jgi:hypothetical protein
VALFLLVLCCLAGFGVSVRLFFQLRDREPSLRWLCAAIPVLSCLFAIEVLAGILRAPTLIWNEIRLSRSLALLHGFHLYPGEHEIGPIIGTLHPPISHYLFIPAAGIHDPTVSIVAGSLLACVVAFSALGFALVRSGPLVSGRWAIAALSFLFCGFLIIQSEGTFSAAFNIHTDAAALAFATIACAFVSSRDRMMTVASVWMSAAACALAIATKQTIAPVALAVSLYIATTEGGKRFALFLLAIAVTGGSLLAFLLAVLPSRAFLFNTLVLASHRPLKPGYTEVLARAYRMGRLEALPALLPLLFLGVCSWTGSRPNCEIRQFFAANRWIVYLMASAALVPVSLKAMVTVGSDVNHLGFVLYFLFVAAGLAIQQYFTDANPAARLSSRLFLTTGILVSVAPGMLLTVDASLRNLRENTSQIAHTYNLRHPGMAYFPDNPMTSLLKDGKLYDLDTALYDREIAGYPLTPQQLQAGLPDSLTLVALPPDAHIQSKALHGLVAGFVPIADPELPGWIVYRRAPQH